MKYPKRQYEELKKAFVCVIVRKGYTIEKVRKNYQECGSNPMRLGWDLFRIADAGLTGRNESCDKVEHYQTYPPGINDSHIKTAVKNILKDIGLWWEIGGEA